MKFSKKRISAILVKGKGVRSENKETKKRRDEEKKKRRTEETKKRRGE